VRFEERADPRIVAPTDAIIRIAAACVCGSDLWPYRGINQLDGPMAMGHEYVGVVEEAGADVRTIRPGQFVIGSFVASDNTCPNCQNGYQTSCVRKEAVLGAQAGLLRVPLADGTLVATPGEPAPELIPSLLTLSDVMGTGWFAAVAARVRPGMTVAVVGDGAVGLLGVLANLDHTITQIRDQGAIGELRFAEDVVLPRTATEYVSSNVWFGASFPRRSDLDAIRDTIGIDHLMWGSDYPHDEGTYPFTTEALRQVFSDWDPADVRRVTAGNAAELYGFDLAALAPHAAVHGPRVAEVARPLTELPDGANEALLANV
jgi:hypothetical protein